MSNSVRIRPLVGALTLAGLASLSLPALAATGDDVEELKQTVRELQRKIEEINNNLDQKVKVVERKQEIAAEDVANAKSKTPVVTASEKGFGFKSPDGGFEIRFRGVAHLDYRNTSGNAISQMPAGGAGLSGANTPLVTGVDGFLARRLRPTLEGTLQGGKYGFRFTPEFAESGDGGGAGTDNRRNNTVRVVDAFFDVNANDAYKLRIGKHKPFVGLERLQSASDIKFIERSYVSNNILPNRDIGVSVFGDVLDKRVSYAVGFFNGVQDGGDNFTTRDENNDKDFAWRVFTTPFANGFGPLTGLGFGVAGTWSVDSTSNSLTSSFRTPGQNQFFRYQTTAARASSTNNSSATLQTDATVSNGDRLRISPQAYYYNGPLGILAEWAQVRQDVARRSANAESPTSSTAFTTLVPGSEDTLKHSAWQVAATWLLTGEDASFKGVKPFSPFKFGEPSGWGAWEVGLRYQEINLDKSAANYADKGNSNGVGNTGNANNGAGFALGARTWGVGLSWYHNENSKFLVNYDFTKLDDVTPGGIRATTNKLTGDTERFLSLRYQLSY